MKIKALLLAPLLVASFGCETKSAPQEEETAEVKPAEEAPKAEAKPSTEKSTNDIVLSSSAFKDGEAIPTKYTCDGDNLSVPLTWSNLPEGTESVAVVMHDPDAPNGTVYHWGIWTIPAAATGLPEGLPPSAEVALSISADTKVVASQSSNIAKTVGYTGPCPPEGDDAHRYIFEVFALDHPGTSFANTPTAEALLSELQTDANAHGTLTGTYQRQK